jgi:NTE family protein/lysophospholipid hydrolase
MNQQGQPLTDQEVVAFVARMKATRTVPDVTDDELAALARTATRRRYLKGELLFNAGEGPDWVYLIASGIVDQITTTESGSEHCVIRATEGYGIGDVPTLSGGHHLTTCRAISDEAFVDCMPIEAYQAFLISHPAALAKILTVTSRRTFRVLTGRALARVLRGGAPYELAPLLDAFEAVKFVRGEPVFRVGDTADGWYVVLTGRVRITMPDGEGSERFLVEAGAGESFGDLALLSNQLRETKVIAVRDTTVARVKPEVFLKWVELFPMLMKACFASLLGRAHAMALGVASKRKPASVFTVVRASEGADVPGFAQQLAASFGRSGKTLHVRAQTLVERHLVPDAHTPGKEHPCWLRTAAWIEDAHTSHAFVVLETDPSAPAWSALAEHLADCLVAVGDAGGVPRSDLTRAASGASTSQRFLALMQKADASEPEGAERWGAQVPEYRPLHVRAGRVADVDRLARIISGRAVTVALGGGGARGIAHIGVLRAFEELGIPVDVIGGTSMGSIIAAQYAMGLSPVQMVELNRDLAASRPFSDYTLPMFALLRTKRIEKMARDAFGDRTIESLWLPYLACSANLATAELVLHERGPVWEATRASGALPGIAQPAIFGGRVLIDGGVLNNLPGDVLRERFGGTVVAVNVSPKEEAQFEVKDFPSPWTAAMRWLKSDALHAPNIVDIMTRAVTLTSTRRARFVEREADVYLAPPIDRFGMLEFSRIDEIEQTGYHYALGVLTERRKELP